MLLYVYIYLLHCLCLILFYVSLLMWYDFFLSLSDTHTRTTNSQGCAFTLCSKFLNFCYEKQQITRWVRERQQRKNNKTTNNNHPNWPHWNKCCIKKKERKNNVSTLNFFVFFCSRNAKREFFSFLYFYIHRLLFTLLYYLKYTYTYMWMYVRELTKWSLCCDCSWMCNDCYFFSAENYIFIVFLI